MVTNTAEPVCVAVKLLEVNVFRSMGGKLEWNICDFK